MRGRLNLLEHASPSRCLSARAGSLRLALLAVTALARPPEPAVAEVCAYVANQDDGTLSVIDTATQTVVSLLQVGAQPADVAVGGAASSPTLYVVNRGDDTLSIIRTAKRRAATVRVGDSPVSVVISPDGARAYVANEGSGSVSVVDTATAVVGAPIEIGCSPQPCPGRGTPRDIALTPDGNQAYVAATGDNRVVVIDTTANQVLAAVALDGSPSAVAVEPAGTVVYVTEAAASPKPPRLRAISPLRVIDLPQNSVPTDLAFAPDGTAVFVGLENPGTDASVFVYNTDPLVQPFRARIPLGSQVEPLGLAITGDGSTLYVTNGGSNEVLVIDTAANAVSGTIPVGSHPRGIAVAAVSGGCSVEQPSPCSGDCNGNGSVSIGELVSGVDAALRAAAPDSCLAFDQDKDGSVAVNELVAAVSAALHGCP